jgi:hypothetical protein
MLFFMINDSVIFFQHMFTQLIDSIQFLIHPTMFINSPTYTCFELNRGQYGHNRKEFPFENQLNPRLEKIASNGIQSFHCQVLHEHLARLNTPSSPDLPRPRDPLGPPRVLDDAATAAAAAAAKKREAAEQVAAFRWRPAPPKVGQSMGEMGEPWRKLAISGDMEIQET